ncbi:unnamed protein product [Amoebophrya sp. A25]|nr:unnamed protein product [Amoebophrya sp. A25]|eukprot:GSA25T00017337001.1
MTVFSKLLRPAAPPLRTGRLLLGTCTKGGSSSSSSTFSSTSRSVAAPASRRQLSSHLPRSSTTLTSRSSHMMKIGTGRGALPQQLLGVRESSCTSSTSSSFSTSSAQTCCSTWSTSASGARRDLSTNSRAIGNILQRPEFKSAPARGGTSSTPGESGDHEGGESLQKQGQHEQQKQQSLQTYETRIKNPFADRRTLDVEPVPSFSQSFSSTTSPTNSSSTTSGTTSSSSSSPSILTGSPPSTSSSLYAEPLQFTQLDNGAKVVSCDRGGAGAHVGLAVHIGSRFENSQEQGCTHLLEMLALRETRHFTNYNMAKLLESIGAHFSIAGGTRETLLYRVEALRDVTRLVVPLLCSNFLAASFQPLEVEEALHKIEESKQLMLLDQHPEGAVNELIHEVAYGSGPGLGSPLLGQDVEQMRSNLQPFHNRFASDGSKMLFCAVNVPHEEFVREVEDCVEECKAVSSEFNEATASSSTTPSEDVESIKSSSTHTEDSEASTTTSTTTSSTSTSTDSSSALQLEHPPFPQPYYGGFLARPSPLGPEQCPLSHVAIAFLLDGGWNGEDVLAASVLQTLLGGGGSFSTGGPGKGMHSRLFTSVLNRYPWVEQCSAFSHQYSDTGLLGIYGIVEPNHAKDFVTIVANTFLDLRAFHPVEVQRAKNQLKSSIFMNLEPNAVLMEDFARQLLMSGVVASGHDFARMVDDVTAEDLTNVGRKLLNAKPTVVHYGNIKEGLSYSEIEHTFDIVRDRFRES